MLYVRPPTEAETQELKRMTREAVGRVRQRAQMVLRLAGGGRGAVLAGAPKGCCLRRAGGASRNWPRSSDKTGSGHGVGSDGSMTPGQPGCTTSRAADVPAMRPGEAK